MILLGQCFGLLSRLLATSRFFLKMVVLATGHSRSCTRWPISKMALVGLSLVTVEVKSSDPPGTGQMIKSPNHGQTCYVKSPAFSLNVRNNLGGIVVAVVDHQ